MILSREESRLYFNLHWALLAYANRCLHVLDRVDEKEDVPLVPADMRVKLRNALYDHSELLKEFIAENQERLTADELSIVAGWQYRVQDDFYILRYLKRYAVFLGHKPSRLYGVLGLSEPIDVVLHGCPLPALVKAVLLPFKDRIIYDGYLSTYSIFFGSGIRSSLNAAYSRLKKREGIVEQLLSPDGKPAMVTSLERRAPRKPPPDWRPVVDEIVTKAEQIRRAATETQGGAAAVLRAAAKLAQMAFQQPDAAEALLKQLSSVRRALTKLENTLYEDMYDEE